MKAKVVLLFLCICTFFSCKKEEENTTAYNESQEIAKQQLHENPRMRFKLIASKLKNEASIFTPFDEELNRFGQHKYEELKSLILERNILQLQKEIATKALTYQDLTLFYLYRMRLLESDPKTSLHAIISLNTNAIEEAKQKDETLQNGTRVNAIFGLPILLKDNIDTQDMPTTAGAVALLHNTTKDAFITQQLKNSGAIILGKANLSEWAYFFCSDCPVGYSAVGGQTLNPYGRKIFESGGSSSGSGVATAANYAVAAVGTETAGSILSPSSQNSIVGLKPTVGLLSRDGIIPISSTLDTPGPMSKFVIDNALLLNAMLGKDDNDKASINANINNYTVGLDTASFKGRKLAVISNLLKDSLYASAVKKIKNAGAKIIEITPPKVSLNGFLTLLSADMKRDLPSYLNKHSNAKYNSVKDIVTFNEKDSLINAPYGQALFERIVKDTTTNEQLHIIRDSLLGNGKKYFEVIKEQHIDAVLSINNYDAAYAAVAKYPAITVPMGYKKSGEPIGLTFIAKQFQEHQLLLLASAFENLTQSRIIPKNYK
ncbi:amidase family protein [Zhouia sp. PK063]|uniref:amidase family protein n=1 Tax=Zhouia sp. PK063 TaxID=3373602 RepID=UPI0037884B10